MAYGQYDNAWETPGWTVQTGHYPDDPSIALTPPAGLKNVAVVGDFFDQSAKPLWGKFTFQPSVQSVKVGGATVVLTAFSAELKHGQLDVNVLSPDNVVTDPPAWSYKIRGRVGPAPLTARLDVPFAGDSVEFAALVSPA